MSSPIDGNLSLWEFDGMLKIGPYQIRSLETGCFALDGGAMFGIVPKTIWEKTNPADEANRITMHARAMLIQDRKRNILVDTGMGQKWAKKFIEIYQVDETRWNLLRSLQEVGLTPEDITDVILTHLHFDHAGGMTKKVGDDLLPVFPNAEVYVQRRNWELAWKPTEKDRASYLSENYSPWADGAMAARKLHLLDTPATEPSGRTAFGLPDAQEEEIFPGISVQISHGHTLGMQTVRVADANTSITYCADLIPTATHVRVPFIMSYDCFPMFILEEKKRLLGRIHEENGLLFYEHCPRMAASKLIQDAKGHYAAGETVEL